MEITPQTVMTWMDVASMASVVIDLLLLVATVAGMVTAWRVYTKQKRDQLFSDYTKRYQDVIRDFPEDVNEPDFSLFSGKGTERGDARFEKTMRAMRMYFDLCFEEWSRHRNKEIDADIWDTWSGGMATAFRKPAFQQAWARITRPNDTNYGEAFTSFVQRIMNVGTLSGK